MAEIKSIYLENGNNALQLEQLEVEFAPTREEIAKRNRELAEKRRRDAQRKHAAVHRKNRAYTFFFLVSMIATCFFFVVYVSMQIDVSRSMRNITALETEISELKASNKAEESRINTNVNIQAIKATAINDLGMVYASNDQIVYYSMDNDDYMNQFTDIP